MLKELTDLSSQVLSSGILRKQDFMGRVYHKLLLKTTGSYYVTYYIAVPSAYILNRLISNEIDSKVFEDNSLDDLTKFRIIDPASGSGTLLSAAYMAIKEKYIDRYGEIDWNKFHRIMIEKVIYGWDVLDYAAHLTLTVLALHNPTVLVNNSNILTMPNGLEMYNGETYISLGSLEFLGDNLDNFYGKDLQKPASIHSLDSNEERYIKLETKDLAGSLISW